MITAPISSSSVSPPGPSCCAVGLAAGDSEGVGEGETCSVAAGEVAVDGWPPHEASRPHAASITAKRPRQRFIRSLNVVTRPKVADPAYAIGRISL
jgi:hypothetical protein